MYHIRTRCAVERDDVVLRDENLGGLGRDQELGGNGNKRAPARELPVKLAPDVPSVLVQNGADRQQRALFVDFVLCVCVCLGGGGGGGAQNG